MYSYGSFALLVSFGKSKITILRGFLELKTLNLKRHFINTQNVIANIYILL